MLITCLIYYKILTYIYSILPQKASVSAWLKPFIYFPWLYPFTVGFVVLTLNFHLGNTHTLLIYNFLLFIFQIKGVTWPSFQSQFLWPRHWSFFYYSFLVFYFVTWSLIFKLISSSWLTNSKSLINFDSNCVLILLLRLHITL